MEDPFADSSDGFDESLSPDSDAWSTSYESESADSLPGSTVGPSTDEESDSWHVSGEALRDTRRLLREPSTRHWDLAGETPWSHYTQACASDVHVSRLTTNSAAQRLSPT